MEITSFHFFLFVLGVLIVHHLLPHRVQNVWLLIASYAFYICWSWQFALLLLAATVFHFELAKHLRSDAQGHPVLLWLGIAANVILFLIFNASSFYFPRLVALLEQMGVQSGLAGLQIVIPLGLSYYVLQNISYLVDVYRGQIPASTRRVDFALYLAYFPKMVAGPIERARTFLPILARPRLVDNQAFSRSLILILVGLTRKLLIANVLFAHLPWESFRGEPSAFSKMELMGWLVVYSFGLYNDFAGYTGIVRGISGLFGIELSPNFNTPYLSRSFTEFWNRWHITLSHWLRDYIFFPVNRALGQRLTNRNGWQNLVIPPMLTMLVSGLWHGPNWQMLLWGALHGIYLVVERLLMLRKPAPAADRKEHWTGWISRVLTFLLVALAWVPFTMRIPNAFDFWQQLLVGNLYGMRDSRLIFPLAVLIPALWLDWAKYDTEEQMFILHRNRTVQAAILAAVIGLILVVTSSGAGQPFVYQGFK
jgi:D-alanyl-lipoteichoic acid acyltransferase DltB (MBOAT superfamily)